MFIHHRTVRLSETDATGVLFFTELLKFGVEALEAFWETKGFSVTDMMGKTFRLPIVHAEGDFSAPIRVGDKIEVHLSKPEIGTTSFTIKTQIIREKIEVGKTKIVHVCISAEKGSPIPIPESILHYFE